MTRPEQDDEERAFIAEMLKRLPLVLSEPPTKRERPDFLLILENGTRVGLEVAQARDSEIAAGRAAINRMKDEVQKALDAAAVAAIVSFSVSEANGARLNKFVRDNARALAKLAIETLPSLLEPPAYDPYVASQDLVAEDAPWLATWYVDELEQRGIFRVDSVRVIRADSPIATWASAGFGGQGHLVQELIDKKAPKLAGYKESASANEYWLLVVAGAGAGGSIADTDVEGPCVHQPFRPHNLSRPIRGPLLRHQFAKAALSTGTTSAVVPRAPWCGEFRRA